MKDNKKHKKAEYGILITGLIILLAATFVTALCAGQYSVSVPEVTKILASRFVNVTKTWSNTAEGVVFTLRLPRIIGAVLVGSALSLSGAAYQGVFKNPLVAPDLLGVSSGACVGEYSCAVTPQVRQTGNRLSGLAGTAYASLFT